MDIVLVTGRVDSDVKVLNTKNGLPLCRFRLLVDDRKFNCIIAGKRAFNFVYEVKLGTGITIECVINNRKQLVVQGYKVNSSPNYFGMVFDYKGRQMPHKKAMF